MTPNRIVMPQLLSRWLCWVSTFYPLFILAQFWVRILPAVVRYWLFGDRLSQVRLDPYLLSAGFRGPSERGSFFGVQATVVFVALLAVPLLAWLRRRFPDAAGRALALIGLALCGNWLITAIIRNAVPARGVIPAIVGFALVVVGLRWAAATIPGGYWMRFGFAMAGFALPAAVLPFFAMGFGRSWFGVATTAPAIALAALALFRLSSLPTEVRLRSAGIGLLATIIAFTAIIQGRRWQQSRHDANLAKALSSLPKPSADAAFPKLYFHRGVNFTANGYGYESEEARTLLGKLPAYGIQAIAVVPYGGMDRQTLRISTARPGTWESDAGVELIAAEAHRQGMKVMLKPHVWRPQSDQLPSPERRDLWFREYSSFIEHYARLAQRIHADTLCIGVEFGSLTEHEAPWRNIIARVRAVYKGPLVYAANHGREFESIRFWDALDYIGLDNYYPLPDDYSTVDLVKRVEAVAKRFDRPVLFTETGYSAAVGAHRTPWADHPPNALSLDEQVRCYEALLSAFYKKPWFAGVYWWKIETDGAGGPDDNGMAPWGKPAMESIKKWYASPQSAAKPD